MKRSFHSPLLLSFLAILIFSSNISSSTVVTKQGEHEIELNEIPSGSSLVDSIGELMGLEECENGDGECLKRRAVSEDHLDYIYTQNHKP